MSLAVLDYGAGNQTSVLRALTFLGIPGQVTASADDLFPASGIIFPGVGAAGQAMRRLADTGLGTVLRELIAMGKPLLGICLGCQILLEFSEEGETETLGIVRGRCRRFSPELRDENGDPATIPHMGWNACIGGGSGRLFRGIAPEAEFYFVHSYYVEPEPDLILARTRHGQEFCSAYGRDGLWAVQFHPEKSGRAGLRLLRNFYEYCAEIGAERGTC